MPQLPRRPAKAQQIADELEKDVAAGVWAPGSWLPSWDLLAERFEAARGTVRSALEILGERGRIQLVPGKGARVAEVEVVRSSDHQVHVVGRWRGWHAAVEEAGKVAWTDTTSITEVPAGEDVATKLGIPAGTPVIERRRIHGVINGSDRVPTYLSATWITPAVGELLPILREQDTGEGGMTSRFIEIGLQVRWEDRVTARRADKSDAEALRLKAGAPLLESWRWCYDQNDRVVEVTWRLVNTANDGAQKYRYP